MPRVVDEDVDPARPVRHLRDHRPDVGVPGHVRLHRERSLAEARRRLPGLLPIASDHRDGGSRPRKSARHPESDAAVAAGHDRDPTGKIE